jgi:cold shock CspA family protein
MATSGNSTPLTGCVKWFDNGLNYGFITVLTEGDHKNIDVFVHQSNIRTKQDCFRTLYTGECVAFELTKSDNAAHPFHAVNVTGFNGVLLHCENPSFRGRGGYRGGRGGSRGGSRGGFRGNNFHRREQPSSFNNTGSDTTVTAADAEPVEETTTQSSVETQVTEVKKAGRGRGKKISA